MRVSASPPQQRFAEEGAFVYLTGRRQAESESAVAKVGHGAVGVQGDVAKAEDMERVYDTVRHNGHRIDVIVANAGSGGFMRLEDVTDEHVETLFGVNVKGALNTVQKALSAAERRGVHRSRHLHGGHDRAGRAGRLFRRQGCGALLCAHLGVLSSGGATSA